MEVRLIHTCDLNLNKYGKQFLRKVYSAAQQHRNASTKWSISLFQETSDSDNEHLMLKNTMTVRDKIWNASVTVGLENTDLRLQAPSASSLPKMK